MFFKHTIFSNLFLKTLPIEGRLVGRPYLVCLILKILLNMCMKWVVGNMSYTFDLIMFSVSIIGSFQLVLLLTFFFYTHICFLYMYAYTSNSINFDWYSIFHTYIYALFVLTISLYLWAQILVMLSLISSMTIIFQLIMFQLVSYSSLCIILFGFS